MKLINSKISNKTQWPSDNITRDYCKRLPLNLHRFVISREESIIDGFYLYQTQKHVNNEWNVCFVSKTKTYRDYTSSCYHNSRFLVNIPKNDIPPLMSSGGRHFYLPCDLSQSEMYTKCERSSSLFFYLFLISFLDDFLHYFGPSSLHSVLSFSLSILFSQTRNWNSLFLFLRIGSLSD